MGSDWGSKYKLYSFSNLFFPRFAFAYSLISHIDKMWAQHSRMIRLDSDQSSQFQGLCSVKSSREIFQILPYFWNKKTQICFFHFSFRATLDLLYSLVYNERSFLSSTNPEIVRCEAPLCVMLSRGFVNDVR